MKPHLCPCCSEKTYDDCCGPYLSQKSNPKTVKQLMRSRYTAFALGGHGDYLLQSWHPGTVGTVTCESLSQKSINWQGLTVLDFQQQGNEGTVSFDAHFLNEDGSTGVHQENSRFLREKGRWLYLDAK